MELAGLVVLAILLLLFARRRKRRQNEDALRYRAEAAAADDFKPWATKRNEPSPVSAAPSTASPRHVSTYTSSLYPSASVEVYIHEEETPQRTQSVGLTDEREKSLKGRRFRIKYMDGEGVLSDRVVLVDRVEAFIDDVYMYGYCETRKGDRQFRSDRILEMVDHDSGDVIYSPGGFLAWFTDTERGSNSEVQRAWQKIKPGITLLAWLAQADGRLTEPEIEVMLDYADRRSAETVPHAELNKAALRYFILSIQPSLGQVQAACKNIAKTKKETRLVLEFAPKVVLAAGDSASLREKMDLIVKQLPVA